ncbi:uncharacterized protein LY79DRAFT_17666 [Colletotrichum navitas]|uniref:Uncharacterized protein n=1 Tax=Colletotrichum navitas TaxID=681940 RepID=A0AAD8QD31_9PEZI|nr:uncharacterized protein LY79DRAFT_17666 [Colletotrichum navitas]KAK1600391.1 hypothetical protein LY79DRAFT_17666 [Colletotrichum navitas]
MGDLWLVLAMVFNYKLTRSFDGRRLRVFFFLLFFLFKKSSKKLVFSQFIVDGQKDAMSGTNSSARPPPPRTGSANVQQQATVPKTVHRHDIDTRRTTLQSCSSNNENAMMLAVRFLTAHLGAYSPGRITARRRPRPGEPRRLRMELGRPARKSRTLALVSVCRTVPIGLLLRLSGVPCKDMIPLCFASGG